MSVLKVLEALMKMESRIAELYRWLSEVFAADTSTSGLFFRLSLQEQSHANLIAYQRRVVIRNLGIFDAPALELQAIENVVAAVDEFRASNPDPSFDAALGFALAIESSAAEEIHRAALAQSSFEIGGLIRVLAGDDRRHGEMLSGLAAARQRQGVPC